MQYVRTVLGKQFVVSYYGDMGNMLFIHFPDQSMKTIADVFSNAVETSMLVFEGGSEMHTYSGYIKLTDMYIDGNGEICITLVNPTI